MNNQKRILILGGSERQLKLIQESKQEGYYIVLCDYDKHNLGCQYADKFYQVSIIDKEKVLKIAHDEKIDGIVSNSEPAMIVVSYVSEKLHLNGNPMSSIETLLSKDKFRNLQETLHLFAPKHYVTNDINDFWHRIKEFRLPIIIKPVESSGSRGTTKIDKLDYDVCIAAFKECINFSRNHFCSIEEFVDSSIDYVIEGEVFVYNDIYFWNGMFFNYRHHKLSMIPTTHSWPLDVDTKIINNIKKSIMMIFKNLNISIGEFNAEIYINKNGDLFFIEINPRQGGNYIPISIEKHCGIDFSRLLVSLSVGDEQYLKQCLENKPECNYFTKHMVFSTKNGILKDIYIDERISKFIKKINYKVKIGSEIEITKNASGVLAYVDLMFDTIENQKKYDSKLENYIYPIYITN